MRKYDVPGQKASQLLGPRASQLLGPKANLHPPGLKVNQPKAKEELVQKGNREPLEEPCLLRL